jgi:hypothetical protein
MAAPLRYLEPLSRSANIMALVAIKIGRRQGATVLRAAKTSRLMLQRRDESHGICGRSIIRILDRGFE